MYTDDMRGVIGVSQQVCKTKQPRQRMWGYPYGVAIIVPVARPYL